MAAVISGGIFNPRPPFNYRCYKNFVKNNSGYRGGSTNKRRDNRRFLLYGLYAWGVPLILTGLTAAMQFSDLPNHIIKPGFGSKRCWFFGKWTFLLLFKEPKRSYDVSPLRSVSLSCSSAIDSATNRERAYGNIDR